MDAAHILTNVAILFVVATLWVGSAKSPAKLPGRKVWLGVAAGLAAASIIARLASASS